MYVLDLQVEEFRGTMNIKVNASATKKNEYEPMKT